MTPHSKEHDEKKILRSRIRSFYRHFDKEDWMGCWQLLDPKLKDGKVDYDDYAKSLAAFFAQYGPLRIVSVPRVTVYADVRNKRYDDRDFAYGLVVWQDKRNEDHLRKERWVKSGEDWYTRLAGLVTHDRGSAD